MVKYEMCKVKAKLGRKNVILQTIGYRGKREAKSEIGDLRQARAFIVYKKDAKGLKVGSTITVKIGRRKIKAIVKRWSRGSKLLLPKEEYPLKNLSAQSIRRVIAG